MEETVTKEEKIEIPAKAVDVPAKSKKIVEEIETMSVLELKIGRAHV